MTTIRPDALGQVAIVLAENLTQFVGSLPKDTKPSVRRAYEDARERARETNDALRRAVAEGNAGT